MDIRTTGHARTLGTHREMQMRDVQRATLAANTPVVDRNALHTDMVIGVDDHGNVKLRNFTDPDTGNGGYFAVFNHTACRYGDIVIYAYVDDTPIVLGKMPSNKTPWRVPDVAAQDTYSFEEFDIGSSVSGNIGLHRWSTFLGSSGTANAVGGDANHPGQLELATTTTLGSFAAAVPGGAIAALPDSLAQFGFGGFGTSLFTGAEGQAIVGLSNDFATLSSYIFALVQTGTWQGQIRVSGGSAVTFDTKLPYTDGHFYRVFFTRIDTGIWFLMVEDVNDGTAGSIALTGAPTTVVLFPYARCYNLIAGTIRKFNLDYAWWARLGLHR